MKSLVALLEIQVQIEQIFVFIYIRLIDCAFSVSDYSNHRMIIETLIGEDMVLFRHLPGGTWKNNENCQSQQPVSRFELVTSRIRCSVNNSAQRSIIK